MQINSGVLNFMLWNILYDGLLRMQLPDVVEIVGFADDISLVVSAKEEQNFMSVSNIAILKITKWMEARRFQMEKTGSRPLRKIALVDFDVQRHKASPARYTKDLGCFLDVVATHVDHITTKANKNYQATCGADAKYGWS